MKRILAILGLTLAAGVASAQTPRIVDADKITRTSSTRNFIRNPDAQYDAQFVTVSNATATRSTTTPLGEAGTEWNVTITSANGTVDFTAAGATTANLGGASCEAALDVRGFQATSKLQVMDGSTVLGEVAIGVQATRRTVSIPFTCPADPSNLKVRLTDTSTLVATNEAAGVYLGKARNVQNVSQAEHVGSWELPGASACQFQLATTSYNQFNADGDCGTPVVTGGVSAPQGKRPWLTIANGRPGVYYVVFSGRMFKSTTTDSNAYFRLAETTQKGAEISVYQAAVEVGGGGTLAGTFTYTSTQQIDLWVEARVDNASAIAQMLNSAGGKMRFDVYRYPLSTQLAVTPENSIKARARYQTAAGQSIPSSSTPTIVDFGSQSFDSRANVTTGGAWKFTAKEAGYYAVNASVMYSNGAGWDSAETATLRIYKNGSEVSINYNAQNNTHSNFVSAQIKDVVYLGIGDYLDVRTSQDSGAARTLLNTAVYNYVDVVQVDGGTQPLLIPPNDETVQAGSADVILNAGSTRKHVITPTANRTFTLPGGADVKSGREFLINNTSAAFTVSVASSASGTACSNNTANTMDPSVRGGEVLLEATQDNPTLCSHWRVKYVHEHFTASVGFTCANASGTAAVQYARSNRVISARVGDMNSGATVLSTNCTISTGTDGMPAARFRPSAALDYIVRGQDNGGNVSSPKMFRVDQTGQLHCYRTPNGDTFTSGTNFNACLSTAFSWTTTN